MIPVSIHTPHSSILMNVSVAAGTVRTYLMSVVPHCCGHLPPGSAQSGCRRVTLGQVGHMRRSASDPRVGSKQMGQSKLRRSGKVVV